MDLITITQGLIFLIFVSFLLIKFKKPLPSLSYSYYYLPKKQKILFSIFSWSLGLLMLFQSIGMSGPWFFISGIGFFYVGAATKFLDVKSVSDEVHYIGAGIALLFAYLGLFFDYGQWIPFVVFIVPSLFIVFMKVKNRTWWVEIIAFITIIIGLLLK